MDKIRSKGYNLKIAMHIEPKLHILFSREEIATTISKLAAEISKDYQGKNPLLIDILKGSFMFMADHIRLSNFPTDYLEKTTNIL